MVDDTKLEEIYNRVMLDPTSKENPNYSKHQKVLDFLILDFNQKLAEGTLKSRYGWEIIDYSPQYGVNKYYANPTYQGTMNQEYLQQRHWYTKNAKIAARIMLGDQEWKHAK